MGLILYWKNKDVLQKQEAKKIEEWLIAEDQKWFGYKSEKQILQEINRFMQGKESIEELMDRKFPKPDFVIEGLDCLKKSIQ